MLNLYIQEHGITIFPLHMGREKKKMELGAEERDRDI